MLFSIVTAAICCLFGYCLIRLRYIRFTQYAHLPGPTPSLLWGHLHLVAKLILRDSSRHFIPITVLLDLRPIHSPVAVIYSHTLAEQISKATAQFPYSVPKSPIKEILGPVAGYTSFLMTNDAPWKHTRKAFNPAFAPGHIVGFVPQILEKVNIFLGYLDGYVQSGEAFSLERRCTLLTFDVIGRTTLNIDVNAQGSDSDQHDVVRSFRELIANMPALPQLEWLLRPRKYRRRMELTRTIETSLQAIIRDKYNALQSEKMSKATDRSVLSLGLEDIDDLTPQAMQEHIDSIRTFLLAGHDTTSVLLQWAIYELSRTPRALAKLRAELDESFGLDPTRTADVIAANPEKLNQLAYLTAVLKETLRLYPPAGTSRLPPLGSNFTLETPQGPLGVDGITLFINHFSIQRDRAVFGPSADAWVPERWLEGKGESAIPASAWRPFERGPRNCIGQELAMLEAKLVLAMVARRYEFTKVGVGAVNGNKQEVDEYGQFVSDEPLYNMFNVSAKPVDGTRMTVRFYESGRA
ncbi:putative cytochrome P450 monooxygenase [Aspergillus heterothallicus]